MPQIVRCREEPLTSAQETAPATGLVSPLVAVWNRQTVRERALSALFALVLMGLAVAQAEHWRADQQDRYQAALADVAATRSERAALARGRFSAADRATLATLADWPVGGRDLWMVRLALEQRLALAAKAAGLPSPEIRIAEGLQGSPSAPLLKAEISGPYLSQPLVGLLRRLCEGPQAVLVDDLQVSDPTTARYRLSLLFPVHFETGGAERP